MGDNEVDSGEDGEDEEVFERLNNMFAIKRRDSLEPRPLQPGDDGFYNDGDGTDDDSDDDSDWHDDGECARASLRKRGASSSRSSAARPEREGGGGDGREAEREERGGGASLLPLAPKR